MTQKIGIRLALFGGIALLTAYITRQFVLLYNAAYKILKDKTQIKSIALNNIDMSVVLQITNRSDLSAQIIGQHYVVYFNDVIVSTIDIKDKVHLNSNGYTNIPIHILFNPKQAATVAFQNLTNFFNDKSKINFEVKGWLSIKLGAIKLKNYPIDIKYTLQEILDAKKQADAEKETTTNSVENVGKKDLAN